MILTSSVCKLRLERHVAIRSGEWSGETVGDWPGARDGERFDGYHQFDGASRDRRRVPQRP